MRHTMVFAPLLAFLAYSFSPCQQQRSNYQRVVERPNPNNGYEDYVRATDVVHSDELDMLLWWRAEDYERMLANKKSVLSGQGGDSKESKSNWSVEDEARLVMAGQFHDLGFLGAQRLAAERFGGALALIRAGNEKQVWDPREKLTLDTALPELAGFKTVVRLCCADAYVRFAGGDTRGGTSDLLDGLTFAHRIGGNNLISELVSIACQSIVLASFEQQLPHLSQRDAAQVVKYTDAALLEPTSYLRSLQRERDVTVSNLDQILADPGSWVTLARDDGTHPNGLEAFMKGMSPRDRETLKEGLTRSLTDGYNRLIAKIGQGEATWAEKPADVPPSPAGFTTVQDVVDEFTRSIMPIHLQATSAVLKARAQLRLLGLHARVIDFRWKNNRLPKDLKEAVPEKLLFDPMGNEPFHYELAGDAYKLYSKGLPATGPIELRYRRPPTLPAQKDDPIPPGSAGSLACYGPRVSR